jgi:hypothetical protein
MAKLEGNAVKANNEVNRLEKKQRDLNDSIKQIPNGEYDQLNKEIDIIITRNIKDFKYSKLAVMTPDQFLKTKFTGQ